MRNLLGALVPPKAKSETEPNSAQMGCKKADPGDYFNPCDFEHDIDNYTLYLSLAQSQPHALSDTVVD